MWVVAALALLLATSAQAEDWPEWRGKGRLGIWNETGILETFPEEGLVVVWRAPIAGGYAGPAVADARVFVTDYQKTEGNRGVERLLCLDEQSGKLLWQSDWEADYTGLERPYTTGPRATPTVDGARVYAMGAMGHLVAVDAADGRLLWQKDFVADFGTEVPAWGMVGAPLVDGDRLVCLVGGQAGAKVVAFDKRTGSEIWRALPSDGEPGYNQPIVFDIGGTRQLIIWHPKAISSLDPATGEIHWEQPFKVTLGMTVSTPVRSGPLLFVSAFFDGGRMLRLTEDPPGAELLWASSGGSDVETDKIHTLINTAVFQGDYLYGIDSYGQARCLEALTGRRLWESLEVTKEKARWAAALIVRNGDRYFINNDRGELIIARLSPQGYQEVSRTQLIEPTSPSTRRRELGAVHWSHPAYANRHIVVRNDREILRASLAKRPD